MSFREALATQAARQPDVIVVSALTGEGVDPLLAAISERIREPQTEDEIVLPFAQGRARAWLHEQGVVRAEREDERGHILRVAWTARQKARFAAL